VITNHSNIEPAKKEDLKSESSTPEELGREESETPSDQGGESIQASNHSRRVGRSKREIMEELSRARFPWDE
jgi:hypothetical protein